MGERLREPDTGISLVPRTCTCTGGHRSPMCAALFSLWPLRRDASASRDNRGQHLEAWSQAGPSSLPGPHQHARTYTSSQNRKASVCVQSTRLLPPFRIEAKNQITWRLNESIPTRSEKRLYLRVYSRKRLFPSCQRHSKQLGLRWRVGASEIHHTSKVWITDEGRWNTLQGAGGFFLRKSHFPSPLQL